MKSPFANCEARLVQEPRNRANGKTLFAIKNPYVLEVYLDLAKEQLSTSVFSKLKERLHEMEKPYSSAVYYGELIPGFVVDDSKMDYAK